MTHTGNIQDILRSKQIHSIKKDLRLMSHSELAGYFAAESSGRIILSKLIKNIIWQAHEKIKAGAEPTIFGNIRTFWYLWVKPVLAHISDDDNVKTDPYDTMLKAFAEMILDLKLFRYADFDFTDENWETRRIGVDRPEILVFSEKTGWIRFLRKLHEDFGVSILALGGAPSALTSEYTAAHIKEALADRNDKIQLIGIVDYDPSGHIIAQAFQDQLAQTGLPNSTLSLLVHPKHYSQEDIEIFRYPLPKKQKTKTAQWMKKTGGINGEPYGLESESMPTEKLYELIKTLIDNSAKLITTK